MADLGAIPMKTCVEVTTTDGQNGTIPGATATAAGVMTAEHVKMLDELWKVHRTKASQGSSPVVVHQRAPEIDTSQFATRMELDQALASIPRHAPDLSAPMQALRQRVESLARQVSDMPAQAEAPPVVVHQEGADGEVVDRRAREILQGVIRGMADVDDRVGDIERKIATLKLVAKQNAEVEKISEGAAA